MTSENSPSKGLARLAAIEHLLYQAGDAGMSRAKLAECLNISTRTLTRDLETIEDQQVFPIWWDAKKCGVLKGKYLPPINFTVPEAMNLFLATRLMLSYANRHDPGIVAIFTKLNSVMPSPFQEQIQHTLSWLKGLPDNPALVSILYHLADAWMQRRSVRITYRSLEADAPAERLIDPYFIQPAAMGRASYVIAWCHKAGALRNFKVERISSIYETDEHYTIPADFNANTLLDNAWDVTIGGKVIEVRLRSRAPEAARLMSETMWHSSQQTRELPDGNVVISLRVTDSQEFTSWVMWWGENIEVLEPTELRNRIAEKVARMASVYS